MHLHDIFAITVWPWQISQSSEEADRWRKCESITSCARARRKRVQSTLHSRCAPRKSVHRTERSAALRLSLSRAGRARPKIAERAAEGWRADRRQGCARSPREITTAAIVPRRRVGVRLLVEAAKRMRGLHRGLNCRGGYLDGRLRALVKVVRLKFLFFFFFLIRFVISISQIFCFRSFARKKAINFNFVVDDVLDWCEIVENET